MLCTEQALRYVEGIGDWIKFPDTIHEMLSHLPETLGINKHIIIKNYHIFLLDSLIPQSCLYMNRIFCLQRISCEYFIKGS